MAGGGSAGTVVLHPESRGAESLDRCPVYRALHRGLFVDSATVRARGAHGALLCGSASGSDAPYDATHGVVYRGSVARNGCDRCPGVLRFSCLASRKATVRRRRIRDLILFSPSRNPDARLRRRPLQNLTLARQAARASRLFPFLARRAGLCEGRSTERERRLTEQLPTIQKTRRADL